jgi:hypothetical protein
MFQNMTSMDHRFDINNPHPMITDILYHIKDNKKAIKGVLSSESGDLLMTNFKAYFSQQIEAFLDNSDSPFRNTPKDFLINHISGSFIEMVKWWVENNMKQTPEELTTYYLSVIAPVLIQ